MDPSTPGRQRTKIWAGKDFWLLESTSLADPDRLIQEGRVRKRPAHKTAQCVAQTGAEEPQTLHGNKPGDDLKQVKDWQ